MKGCEGNQGRLLGLLWVMVELWVPPQPCISSPALASCEAGKLRSWFSLWGFCCEIQAALEAFPSPLTHIHQCLMKQTLAAPFSLAAQSLQLFSALSELDCDGKHADLPQRAYKALYGQQKPKPEQ